MSFIQKGPSRYYIQHSFAIIYPWARQHDGYFVIKEQVRAARKTPKFVCATIAFYGPFNRHQDAEVVLNQIKEKD